MDFSSHSTQQSMCKHVILIAEDETSLRLILSDYLSDTGFDVLEAINADEAVTQLKAGIKIDLVFTDIQMPGSLDGVALARWLLSFRPTLPVILTSGLLSPALDPTHRHRRFIPKPYDLGELQQHMRLMLQ